MLIIKLLTFSFIILLFYIPQLFFVIFTFGSYKKWNKNRTSASKALMVSSAISTLTLLVLSVFPTYYTFTSLNDPLFFVPLIQILFLALPLALVILIIGWSSTILFITIQAKIKNVETDIKKWQNITATIIVVLSITGFALFSFNNNVLNKAESVQTSPEVLKDLSDHSKLNVRRAVAGNPNTPEDILYKLYEEKLKTGYRAHTYELSNNPKTPSDILRKIYKDTDTLDYITYYIAQNPNTPEDILWELANKINQSDYIIGLASNPNLPSDLVNKLKNHSSKNVRKIVNEIYGE